jgi:hypothetical protein
MTPDQADRLRRLSESRDRSQAALMRDALDQLLGDEDRARRLDRARAVVGRFRSGPSFTSVDHDQALAEAFAS